LSFRLCDRLADIFPNSNHVRLLGLEQAVDGALWQYAGSNGYTLVSLDADFAEMAALLGPPPKVIWLRHGNRPTAAIERLLRCMPRRSSPLVPMQPRVWRFRAESDQDDPYPSWAK
jgi:predicted nuclease of predicted toxin-antitoxin system